MLGIDSKHPSGVSSTVRMIFQSDSYLLMYRHEQTGVEKYGTPGGHRNQSKSWQSDTTEFLTRGIRSSNRHSSLSLKQPKLIQPLNLFHRLQMMQPRTAPQLLRPNRNQSLKKRSSTILLPRTTGAKATRSPRKKQKPRLNPRNLSHLNQRGPRYRTTRTSHQKRNGRRRNGPPLRNDLSSVFG